MTTRVIASLLLACLTLGCAPTPAAPNVVQATNPSTEADPNAVAPDALLTELAATGINAGVLMGPIIKQLGLLASAYYDARSKHSKAYHVADISGWVFQNGFYTHGAPTDATVLHAQFQDNVGNPVIWDVTNADNYSADLHDSFPRELAQIRMDVDQQLPGTARMSLTLFAPMGTDATAAINAFGSGSLTLAAPLGQANFEALTATFHAGGEVEQGQLGLKSLANASTLQFSSAFVSTGLDGAGKVLLNAHPAGTVVFDTATSKWNIVNAKGSFPVQ